MTSSQSNGNFEMHFRSHPPGEKVINFETMLLLEKLNPKWWQFLVAASNMRHISGIKHHRIRRSIKGHLSWNPRFVKTMTLDVHFRVVLDLDPGSHRDSMNYATTFGVLPGTNVGKFLSGLISRSSPTPMTLHRQRWIAIHFQEIPSIRVECNHECD